MTHIVPAVRIIAALMFSAALGGGVATANAAPCQMYLADGQLAPCAPDVVSEKPGEYGGDNDPASDPAPFAHTLVDVLPEAHAPVEEKPAEEKPVDDDKISIPQPEVKDPDKEKEEKEREQKEKERLEKERLEKEQQEKEQKEREQSAPS